MSAQVTHPAARATESLIRAGILSPGARGMYLSTAIEQLAETNYEGSVTVAARVVASHGVVSVVILEQYFTDDDVYDGDIDYQSERFTLHTWERDDTNVTKWVADILDRYGVTFGATGAEWAADPDGSYVTNYRTGMRVTTSAFLYAPESAHTDAMMHTLNRRETIK